MNPQPAISVILPVHDARDTLAECIDSILGQSFTDFELVCIDDASSDDSRDILGSYRARDPRVHVIANAHNLGMGPSRNRALRQARGAWVFHVDPDDTLPPRALETLHGHAVTHGSDIVKGAYLREQLHHRTAFEQPEVRGALQGAHALVNLHPRDVPQLLTSPEGHWSCLYSAELARRVPYPTDLKMGQDAIYMVCALLAARSITLIGDVVYRYRANPASTMNAFSFSKYLDVLEWRRRAWHMLSAAGLRATGDQVLLGYARLRWHEVFFKRQARQPERGQLERLGHRLRAAFREAGLSPLDGEPPPRLRPFFERLLAGDHDAAAEHIAALALADEEEALAPDADRLPLSVILPVHNARDTLAECIDSILGQSFGDFELICVDDASSDDSRDILEGYRARDPRVHVLANASNLGMGASRNRALRQARGAYVFHVDPDDTLPPRALEILHGHAVAHGSDIVKGAYLKQQVVFGLPSTARAELRSLASAPIVNTRLTDMPELLAHTEGHWSCLYRRRLAKQVPYPTDLKMGQDSLFLVEAMLRARSITVIGDVVYRYRVNRLSAMNTFSFRKYMDSVEWRRRAWHLLSAAGLEPIGRRLLREFWSEAFFAHLPLHANAPQFDEFLPQLRRAFREAGVRELGGEMPEFQRALFALVLAGRDEEARELIVERARDSALAAREADPQAGGMRVATLCSLDHGGAGTGSQRRVAALRRHGVDARLFSLVVKSKHGYVQHLGRATAWREVAAHAVAAPERVPGLRAREMFSLPNAVLDFRRLARLFERFDVVHLHWVVGMLDYEHLGEVLGDKPVVWTLADMNAFTGGCHYSEGCEGFKRECRRCPLLGGESDLAHETWQLKKRAYGALKNLHIICPSPWMAERARQSSLLGDRPIHYIPNAIPVGKLRLTSKPVARIRLGLPPGKKLLLAGAESLAKPRKGGDLLEAALAHYRESAPDADVELAVFGHQSVDAPVPVHRLGYLADDEKLALAYSAADAYLFPSREDNAPLTVAEALLCGTPVVAFPVGNVPQIVRHGVTGYIAAPMDVADFAAGIAWALSASRAESVARSARCRLDAAALHDPRLAVERHAALYRRAMAPA